MGDREQIEYAKVVLKNILADKYVSVLGVSIVAIRQIRKDKGITKRAMNKAKKLLGVQSVNFEGIQYWHLPKQGSEGNE